MTKSGKRSEDDADTDNILAFPVSRPFGLIFTYFLLIADEFLQLELSYFFLIMICSLVYLESMSKIWRRST